MLKGILSGSIFGLLIGGVGVIVASLAGQQPAGNAPPATPQVEAPVATPDIVVGDAPDEPQLAADDAVTGTTSVVVAPLAEPSAPIADTTPLALPQTAAVEGALTPPAALSLPDINADEESPVLPNPQSIAPQVPQSEGDIEISTASAPPIPVETPPVVVVDDTIEGVVMAEQGDSTPEVSAADISESEAASPIQPVTAEAATAEPTQGVAPVEVVTAPVAPSDNSAPQIEAEAAAIAVVADPITIIPAENQTVDVAVAEVVTGTEPQAAVAEPVTADPITPTETDAEVVAGTEEIAVVEPPNDTADASEAMTPETSETSAVVPEISPEPAPDPAVETAQEPTPETAEPPVVVSIIGNGDARLPTGNTGVRINRRLGTSAEPEVAAAPETEAAPIDPDAPAIQRYAARFDNPQDKPVMAVILLDDGEILNADSALAQLPFVVTVALTPTDAGAADRMQAYRAAGLEVAIRADLPDRATPADVEVAMAAGLDLLPETVLLIDDGTGSGLSGRGVTDQMIATLAEGGRGFVSVSKGLNTGLRTAETLGVPAATIFRDLDADGQDARVIGRFLEQAAFRARQNSGVVLMARLRPETLTALANWGTSSRAGQVAIAPVSAVLMAQ